MVFTKVHLYEQKIKEESEYFKSKHIRVRVIDLPTTMIELPEGIAVAKAKGKELGRPKAKYHGNWEQVYNERKATKITAKGAMEQLNMKRTSFYKLASLYEK